MKKMNKGLTITLITLLTILLFGVVGFMIFVMNGKLDLSNIKIGFSGQSETLIDSKEITSIKDININSDVADIYVEDTESSTIKVELYSDDASEYSITDENDQIKIVLKEKRTVKMFKKNAVIRVYAPKSFNKDFIINGRTGDIEIASYENSNIKAELTTGDIELADINNVDIKLTTGDITIGNAKETNLESTTGDIEINSATKLAISTRTGDVKVGEVDDVKIKLTTGDIEINTINNKLDLTSTTGDIDIDNATVKENSSIESGTGDVNVKSATGCYIDANAKIGDTKVNNNDRKSDIELKITSRTGDIRVNY